MGVLYKQCRQIANAPPPPMAIKPSDKLSRLFNTANIDSILHV